MGGGSLNFMALPKAQLKSWAFGRALPFLANIAVQLNKNK